MVEANFRHQSPRHRGGGQREDRASPRSVPVGPDGRSFPQFVSTVGFEKTDYRLVIVPLRNETSCPELQLNLLLSTRPRPDKFCGCVDVLLPDFISFVDLRCGAYDRRACFRPQGF